MQNSSASAVVQGEADAQKGRVVYRVDIKPVLIMALLDSRRDLQSVSLNRLAY